MSKKTTAEEFYEKALGSENEKNEVLDELRKLNKTVESTATNVKYLTWFLLYLPLVIGGLYIIYWLSIQVE